MKNYSLFLPSGLFIGQRQAQILSVREQARVINENLAERYGNPVA